MFIELNYPDSAGSGCPYCGHPLSFKMADKERIAYPKMQAETKLYKCHCPRDNHVTFVKITNENREDDYKIYKMMYVFAQDWIDHIECNCRYGVESDALFTNTMQNEDELWQRRQTKKDSKLPRHQRLPLEEQWVGGLYPRKTR